MQTTNVDVYSIYHGIVDVIKKEVVTNLVKKAQDDLSVSKKNRASQFRKSSHLVDQAYQEFEKRIDEAIESTTSYQTKSVLKATKSYGTRTFFFSNCFVEVGRWFEKGKIYTVESTDEYISSIIEELRDKGEIEEEALQESESVNISSKALES